MRRLCLWKTHASLSGTSPAAVSPADARLAELQHYVQRETDALVLAKDVVKQLEGIATLDQKALAEVGLSNNFSSYNCTLYVLVLILDNSPAKPAWAPVTVYVKHIFMW